MASILIIDDNEQTRGFLRTALEQHGHTVTEAGEGKTALQQLRRVPVDLVLTDIYMPDCDGLEVIVQLRREFPSIKIVAISGGSGDRNLLTAAQQLGAGAILEKPVEMATLLKGIASALHGEADCTLPPVSSQ